MAQAAGCLLLRRVSSSGKTALFMSCDKVKFRRAVRPGDQLLIRVKMTKSRGNKIGVAEAECTVNGQPASSAELMFTMVDSEEMD
jgi:UDP-3-O-[3-hydroxymyristoyl] N-acetylglucosamine deacetylase/3-hydroxyacyl-[acyl-carrier-protein] dehydratase